MTNISHLYWLIPAILVGFLVPFLFGNIRSFPVDAYYLVYYLAVGGFFFVYIKQTSFDYKGFVSTNQVAGIVFGLIFAALMAKNVYSRPGTEKLAEEVLVWALLWRGLIYGIVDGLFLSSFSWIVIWRAFDVASRPMSGKIGFTLVAWIFIMIMTTAYHAGYEDFRSKKIIQPAIGNTLISVPMFLSTNPIASPLAHAGMHIAAVLHSPKTELYLPPHR